MRVCACAVCVRVWVWEVPGIQREHSRPPQPSIRFVLPVSSTQRQTFSPTLASGPVCFLTSNPASDHTSSPTPASGPVPCPPEQPGVANGRGTTKDTPNLLAHILLAHIRRADSARSYSPGWQTGGEQPKTPRPAEREGAQQGRRMCGHWLDTGWTWVKRRVSGQGSFDISRRPAQLVWRRLRRPLGVVLADRCGAGCLVLLTGRCGAGYVVEQVWCGAD